VARARFVPSVVAPERFERARVVAVRGSDVAIVDEGALADSALFLGELDGEPCFAIDLDGDGVADIGVPLVNLYGFHGTVDDDVWALAGRAVQLVAWARTHRHCGACGAPTEAAVGERAMRCPSCGLLAFPRLAPAVICLVERDDGRALLARNRTFPVPMYSCLAGFVEPGEDLESAVHREVHEEVGVALGDVRYAGSQPWPFPHSLMIGFEARYAGGDIVIDESEIADAQWFSADDLPMVPPPLSIARTLIDAWISRQRA
jgi:NAD+ diphosphatase